MAPPLSIFGQWYPILLDAGLWPRPCFPPELTKDKKGKACCCVGWTDPNWKPDDEKRYDLLHDLGFGVGVLLGSPIKDLVLGCLDVDLDAYARPALELIGKDALTARFGSRGIGILYPVPEGTPNCYYDREDEVRIGEGLYRNKFVVLPPTIHPKTKKPYEWKGPDLVQALRSERP